MAQVWIGWMVVLVAFMFAGQRVARSGDTAPAPRFKVRGSEILGPDGKPVRLRGFNALWWVPATGKDAEQIKALKANCVRYMFGYHPRGAFDETMIACVERQLPAFTQTGLWVIPTVHTFCRDEKWPWHDEELQREFLDMWTHIIKRFKDDPRILAWEPLNEPHSDGLDTPTLRAWYERVIAHIRKLDPDRPIVVEGRGYSHAHTLEDELKLDDPNIIYSFHMYVPHKYTHQKKDVPVEYPGQWNRATLADAIAPAVRFREKYNVPIYCGEWGTVTGAPGYDKWLLDVASILEEHGFHWTHWAWAHKPKNPVNDSFDVNTEKKGIHEIMMKVLEDAMDAGPAILSRPKRSVFPGSRYTYRITANGSPLPALEVEGLPAWLAFDGIATIAGTPGEGDVGRTGEIVARASSSAGRREQRFRIDVPDPVIGKGTGLQGEYFGSTKLTEPKFSRLDRSVDFNWKNTGPEGAIDRTSFSVRWTGEVQAQLTEEYTFYTRTDDGARLWVNGKPLVDQWVEQGAREHRGRIWLEAGKKYRIKMEYLQTGGGAEARLLWSSEQTPKQVVPTSQLYPGKG